MKSWNIRQQLIPLFRVVFPSSGSIDSSHLLASQSPSSSSSSLSLSLPILMQLRIYQKLNFIFLLLEVFLRVPGYPGLAERERWPQGSRPDDEGPQSFPGQLASTANPRGLPAPQRPLVLTPVLPVCGRGQPQESRGPDASDLAVAALAAIWDVSAAAAPAEPAQHPVVPEQQPRSAELRREPAKLELRGAVQAGEPR